MPVALEECIREVKSNVMDLTLIWRLVGGPSISLSILGTYYLQGTILRAFQILTHFLFIIILYNSYYY